LDKARHDRPPPEFDPNPCSVELGAVSNCPIVQICHLPYNVGTVLAVCKYTHPDVNKSADPPFCLPTISLSVDESEEFPSISED
jgi:hypothetical protein